MNKHGITPPTPAQAAERELAGAMGSGDPFRLLRAIEGHIEHGNLSPAARMDAEKNVAALKKHMPIPIGAQRGRV